MRSGSPRASPSSSEPAPRRTHHPRAPRRRRTQLASHRNSGASGGVPKSIRDQPLNAPPITRRALLRSGAIGTASLAVAGPVSLALGAPAARAAATLRRTRTRTRTRAATGSTDLTPTFDFNRDWRFGGVYRSGSQNPRYSDSQFEQVTLPHTVTRLSWGNWDPSSWEELWIYRKRFSASTLPVGRVFLDFDGVLTNATVYLNGTELATHLGGYLPFSVELTQALLAGENDLAVVVDGRWLDVPPSGGASGPDSIDYFQPAGIHRDVTLSVVPPAYLADVFAAAKNVLSDRPTLDLEITVDAASDTEGAGATATTTNMTLTVELLRGTKRIRHHTATHSIRPGTNTLELSLDRLHGIERWSPDSPTLYTVRVTLSSPFQASHTVEITTGFREATFTTDGFFLNGKRLQIFGLNRHEIFPYTGMSAPDRLHARDAQLLKQELNCNMVRCSHYPQSPAFLDACDQLGLMVWEEAPGWQYVGDESFQAIFLQNVHDMIVRDRSRPSVVVWGTRPDETTSYPTLYAEARRMAHTLDGTRQTTGAMSIHSTEGWAEDVFAFDDYSHSDSGAELEAPLSGIPYLVSEAVGSKEGEPLFRWVDTSTVLGDQARLHAQVNDIARGNPAYCGVLAWAGIDYDSGNSTADNEGAIWNGLKWPGILDTFRVAKPGAAFYRSQVSPTATPVIVPAFYWDFGPGSPSTGPGPGAMLATNCDTLEVYVGGTLLTTATPDRTDYGNLEYPPVIVDLTVEDGSTQPQLTVLGYVQGVHVTTLEMSSEPSRDRLALLLDDTRIAGDGSDGTRAVFRALDAFGNQRPYVSGDVSLSLDGPAELIATNPFPFATYGGVGGAVIRSRPGRHGDVTLTATHPTLGSATAKLKVTAASGRYL